jgi:hypothetical protein
MRHRDQVTDRSCRHADGGARLDGCAAPARPSLFDETSAVARRRSTHAKMRAASPNVSGIVHDVRGRDDRATSVTRTRLRTGGR